MVAGGPARAFTIQASEAVAARRRQLSLKRMDRRIFIATVIRPKRRRSLASGGDGAGCGRLGGR